MAHELFHSLKARKRQAKTYMAVKTDISKAYDRVEWTFLRNAMEALGFCDKWIQWIMGCIQSVTYSVMLNGSPVGHIQPSRGLRQGDPLSPYLFLFCAEILSQKLDQAHQRGELHGLSISNGGPRVSHLFFADDSLFFCKANASNSKCLASILDQYAIASGQRVNYDKSSIYFGSKVYACNQSTVRNILHIQNVGGCGKYLGLPEEFGRKKKEMFTFLVDKVKERTSGWNSHFLSPAGKEILLKSIALAMPVHSMSYFKLPKTICEEINGIMSNFWWGSKQGKRKMAWVGWKRLAHSKRSGGLGFKDIADFNQALLGNQVWRIMNSPESLVFRLLKSRYFPNSHILNAGLGSKPSFGWTSLLHGRDLLARGLRWQLGEGNIRLFQDNWLPDDPPHPATISPSLHSSSATSDLLVRHLWSNNQWDVDKLHVLSDADRTAALQLYIPQSPQVDTLVWHYTRHGGYTAKSGYWLASQLRDDMVLPPLGDPAIKAQLWKSPLPPKLKFFGWRAMSSALGTASSLYQRGMLADQTCQRCHGEAETINHILFSCPHAILTWEALPSNPFASSAPSQNLDTNLSILLTPQPYSDSLLIHRFWVCWMLWKARNELLFNNTSWQPQTIITKASLEAMEWLTAGIAAPPTSPSPSNTTHSPPPPLDVPFGWVKCNHDASFLSATNTVGAGWVVSNDVGHFVTAASSRLPPATSALEAEAFSLLHAIHHLRFRGFQNIIFEGDSQVLIDLILGKRKDITVDGLIKDIRFWLNLFVGVRLAHTKRANNSVAHCLAQEGRSQDHLCCIFNHIPDCISHLFV